jgi:hypothetical protein
MLSAASKLLLGAALILGTAMAASAQDAAEDTANWFYAGSQGERAGILDRMERTGATDNTALFGLGAVRYFSAVEGLMQDLHRHGYLPPRSNVVSGLDVLIPPNENPEPLIYERFREILVRFETGLEDARATLAAVDQDEPVAITIDFTRARVNATGAETTDPAMAFAAILQRLNGPPRRPTRAQQSEQIAQQSLEFRFDNADAIWLEGYSNVILAQVDFLLAHDFRDAFDASFHVVFPNSDLPMQKALEPLDPNDMDTFRREQWIADVISFIHLANWPVVEPDRRAGAAGHLGEVARLSRANWQAIRAETDNDREWLPGPQQPGTHPLTGIEVTEEMVQGWMETIGLMEDVLAGKRLVPHWRFPGKGINLKAFFESGNKFDPVLLLTGPGAVPFLEAGDIVTEKDWRDINRLFGRQNAMLIATWFN